MDADTMPPTPLTSVPDAVVAERDDGNRTDQPERVAVAAQNNEKATMLWRHGLPPDSVILAPPVDATTTPMRHPRNVWAMLIVAADVLDDTAPGREGEVALFAGCWLAEQQTASQCAGDLVIRLTAPDDEASLDDVVDVEMMLAHQNRWLRVAEWEGVDSRWPWTVALTAAAIMGLHAEATEIAAFRARATVPPAVDGSLQGHGSSGGINDLLRAGLVQVDDEFFWDRPGLEVCHTVRIRPTGRLALADGRTFVNPSGALTALGAKHQNGWKTWRRASDGRLLGDLRAELRTSRGLPGEPRRR